MTNRILQKTITTILTLLIVVAAASLLVFWKDDVARQFLEIAISGAFTALLLLQLSQAKEFSEKTIGLRVFALIAYGILMTARTVEFCDRWRIFFCAAFWLSFSIHILVLRIHKTNQRASR